eukprot:TRINITY_DN12974_c0_g1_i1.p2 TRINITY_DN12974_c0_g1~~TRINITY_DN12974_c0_g1_i1.p2  ORF type:complete len:66 (-),score=4.69 TRINITY_DN12974_c0_g1_i1:600-797(-)
MISSEQLKETFVQSWYTIFYVVCSLTYRWCLEISFSREYSSLYQICVTTGLRIRKRRRWACDMVG